MKYFGNILIYLAIVILIVVGGVLTNQETPGVLRNEPISTVSIKGFMQNFQSVPSRQVLVTNIFARIPLPTTNVEETFISIDKTLNNVFTNSENIFTNVSKTWSKYPAITNVNMNGKNITNATDITATNINTKDVNLGRRIYNNNVVEVNGVMFYMFDYNEYWTTNFSDLPSNVWQWSYYPAIQNVNIGGNSVTNINEVRANVYYGDGSHLTGITNGSGNGTSIVYGTTSSSAYRGDWGAAVSNNILNWSTYPALQNVNINNKLLTNVNSIYFNGGGSITYSNSTFYFGDN